LDFIKQLLRGIADLTETILVTGGAGFIGSHVVDQLVSKNYKVVVIDDLSTGSLANLNSHTEFRQLDIRSPKVHELIVQFKPKAICHLAAQVSVRNSVEEPERDAAINILGSINLFQAAVKAGVPKVIFSSTGGAIYGEQDYFPADEAHPLRPVSPYGVAKMAVEKYLDFYRWEHGLNYVALRYANVYGPKQDPHGEAGVVAIFTKKLLAQQPATINGDGAQTRDFVYVEDVARANVLALESSFSGALNIGTAIETDINALFQLLRKLTDSTMQEYHGPPKPGEQRRSVIDYGKARAVLQWEPLTPLEQGLKETLNYFQAK
jgi:UDP-glucose 4-epimerase